MLFSLPMALLNSTPKQQKFLLRFFYHAFSESQALAEEQKPLSRSQPSKIIKFEVILAHSRTDANLPENGFVEDAQTEVELISDFPTADPHQTSEESAAIDFTTSTEPRCWAGAETTTNLILPDRYVHRVWRRSFLIHMRSPMDIRLTAFDHVAVLREQEPGELQSYSAALQALFVPCPAFACYTRLTTISPACKGNWEQMTVSLLLLHLLILSSTAGKLMCSTRASASGKVMRHFQLVLMGRMSNLRLGCLAKVY